MVAGTDRPGRLLAGADIGAAGDRGTDPGVQRAAVAIATGGAECGLCIQESVHDIPPGKLVDELGLKGTRVGGAVISEVHGNFIVNEGGARADDVLRLIALVQERARAARGIELEPELEIVGEME
jgi:UDP-N-acetylenolpyruvoylglucosamine reductase